MLVAHPPAALTNAFRRQACCVMMGRLECRFPKLQKIPFEALASKALLLTQHFHEAPLVARVVDLSSIRILVWSPQGKTKSASSWRHRLWILPQGDFVPDGSSNLAQLMHSIFSAGRKHLLHVAWCFGIWCNASPLCNMSHRFPRHAVSVFSIISDLHFSSALKTYSRCGKGKRHGIRELAFVCSWAPLRSGASYTP